MKRINKVGIVLLDFDSEVIEFMEALNRVIMHSTNILTLKQLNDYNKKIRASITKQFKLDYLEKLKEISYDNLSDYKDLLFSIKSKLGNIDEDDAYYITIDVAINDFLIDINDAYIYYLKK